jgi:phage repressor protein C with HTH and peptisase S24 domain
MELLAEAGGPTQVELETGTPKSHLSAITGGRRGVGDELAAKLEAAYNKPTGWFDMPVEDEGSEDLDARSDVEAIRTVQLRLQAGIHGVVVEAMEKDGEPIFLLKTWLHRRGLKAKHLVGVRVKGDSMEPTLYQGDMVVLNLASTEPRDGGVFAINYEGEAIIKRLVRDDGSWWLDSDNTDKRRHPRKLCADSGCLLVGEVVHRQSDRI